MKQEGEEDRQLDGIRGRGCQGVCANKKEMKEGLRLGKEDHVENQ